MSKDLKIELFNIYDVVVFEDENRITQDCVCCILKDKDEEADVIGVIGCNEYNINIYKNGGYKVWEKSGKNFSYYPTTKKILHLYTLKNDNRFYEVYPTDDYGVIDNANPSEALNGLEFICKILKEKSIDIKWLFKNDYNIIKQTLIKAQKQEKVLSIIKEYQVDIWLLKQCDYENYIRIRKEAIVSVGKIVNENGIISEDEIPEEYFDLLKEVFGNE